MYLKHFISIHILKKDLYTECYFFGQVLLFDLPLFRDTYVS